MIARAEDAEKRNHQLHVDLTTAQARVAALEGREVIVVEALKQAKEEHVQKLMEAYLVTHNQRRALRIQEPASSNPVQPIKAEDPQILEELFEPFTLKKIPAPSHEVKEEAASTPSALPPSEELQEPVQLEEEFDRVLPSQLPPEEVINISSLLTHPGDVSD
uniref:Uncharacterized protein n=1 Tax=Zea mays TaxID=4577 RepID=A0A804M9V4_MAIZE